MRMTCPECGAQAHVSAFFVEDDGKRLAGLFAEMEPVLGRAVLGYLGLFKPVKTALRLSRAVKLTQELVALVNAGTVCRDERAGVRRAATPWLWAQGIEAMLAQRSSLSLPLENHNYLRAVVFGLADKADAAAERQREEDARAGRSRGMGVSGQAAPETPLQRQLAWIGQQVHVGAMSEAAARMARAKAREKYQ